VRYFTECDRAAFAQRSYEIAEAYEEQRVALKWKGVIEGR
jgi:hypothetical protein